MIGTLQKYNVTLLGQSYALVSDESEAAIQAALQLVETTMQDLASQTTTIDRQKITFLTAMTLALKQVQLEQNVALHADQQAKLMSLLTHVDVDLSE